MKIGFISLFTIAISAASISAYAYNIEQLNQFEKTNVCESCDLSSAKFGVGANPKSTNHSGARLVNANLSGIHSERMNLSEANLQNANLSGATLDYGNLSYADLTGANFDGAYLIDTNLFGAKGAKLENANICDSTMPDGTASIACNK